MQIRGREIEREKKIIRNCRDGGKDIKESKMTSETKEVECSVKER